MEQHQPLSSLALRTLATSNTIQNLSSGTNKLGRVNSPMTNLTLNLSELSTGRVTPRRKLSLSSLDTPNTSSNPTPERSISTESGCFVDSPSPIDSPTLDFMCESRFSTGKPEVQAEAVSRRKTVAFRRFNSMPVPMMRLSPENMENEVLMANQSTPQSIDIESATSTCCGLLNMSTDTPSDASSERHSSSENMSGSSTGSVASRSGEKRATFYIDECSQDSGLEADRADSRDSKDSMDGFLFAAPKGLPIRRHSKMISEDTCSPFKYSPVKNYSPSKRRNSCPVGTLDFSGEFVKKTLSEDGDSPLKVCRLTSVDEGIDDDGFLDVMNADAEVAALTKKTTPTTSAMLSLFNAPVINKKSHVTGDDDDTPVSRRVLCRRNISRSMSMVVRPHGTSYKRDQPDAGDSPMQFSFKRDPPQDESTPIQKQKRARPSSMITSPVSSATVRPTLHRCHSESEAMIKSALNRQADEPDLVGDCSKTHCLPTYGGKHQDLKYISSSTLSQVIRGEYGQEIEKAVIVDCRYPYEFQGGHIQGAKNLYTTEHIISEFMKNPIKADDPNKRVILIFHCEFSSERGPKMSRFLRKSDRQANKDCYPYLFYPEIYLLDGGYKVYFETEKNHCEPQTYKPMLHKDHTEDLRHFRTKSKSWAGEQRSRPGFRPLKF
ncbi:M-phase inducer phosphatase 1-like [Mercenaria mercenaria]|uniref:M-phase inducer phosphatase 1-like n=1 Tax=Mercenaria mercenaria TaxID=6596 RepID=UPI00234FA733|nr:M-phase inducer phosphatase 1-like [Mercenaria mercenaria]